MLRVCYIAGREAGYSRTRIMLKALKSAGFEVIPCLPPNKSFRHYPGLLWSFVKQKRSCDLVVVGFYGQLLMPFVFLLTRKPVLYDLYISTFDTMVYDRSKADARSLAAKIYYLSDRISMWMADGILLETRDHIRDYAIKFKIPESRFFHLFLAVDDALIPKSGATALTNNGPFRVHFHGEYAPFHGVKHILRAAALLREENVLFDLIGTGITYEEDRTLARELDLQNVNFVDWVPYEALGNSMLEADCCLGIFGENPRTLRVLTNKVVEALAVGSPLITAENDPVRELLTDGESALLVPRANPAAIAGAILKLKNDADLRTKIGDSGKQVFLNHCTMARFSKQLKHIVERMAEE